jgi:hypothetical protein
MSLYSLAFTDCSGRLLHDHRCEAANVSQALAQANRRLSTLWLRDHGSRIDPRGRVDVLDQQGSTVARIHCADAITAMS